MIDQRSRAEERRIRELVREYLQQGYAVVTDRGSEALPGFLETLQPDVVAMSSDDNVIIEVCSRGSLVTRGDRIAQLAEAVNQVDGWRFELVVSNPKSDEIEFAEHDLLGHHEIRRILDLSKELVADQDSALAGIVAWSAAEAALRNHAAVHGLPAKDASIDVIIKRLYIDGLLSDDETDILRRSLNQRNRVSHGGQPDVPAHAWLEPLFTIVQNLSGQR